MTRAGATSAVCAAVAASSACTLIFDPPDEIVVAGAPDAAAPDVDAEVDPGLPNVDGRWLLSVPSLDEFIRFDSNFEFTATGDTGWITITAQPLRVADAAPVGDVLMSARVEVLSNGTFTAGIAGTVPGAAIPNGNANVEVDVSLVSEMLTANRVCGPLLGTADGVKLMNATWAAVPYGENGELPVPVGRCEGAPFATVAPLGGPIVLGGVR